MKLALAETSGPLRRVVEPLLEELMTPESFCHDGMAILSGVMPPPLSTHAVSDFHGPPALAGRGNRKPHGWIAAAASRLIISPSHRGRSSQASSTLPTKARPPFATVQTFRLTPTSRFTSAPIKLPARRTRSEERRVGKE